MPPSVPSTKYTKPDRPKIQDTSARCAANSAANDSKKAAKEYDTPKISARHTKVAQTTTQP